MVAGLIDLSSGLVQLPNPVVVDTNILIERLVTAYPNLYPRILLNAQRSAFVFQSLMATRGVGIVTPTVYSEFIHFAIKTRYKRERITNRMALIARYGKVPEWPDLYKSEPDILHHAGPELDRIRRGLIAARLVIVAPHDIPPLARIHGHDEELIALVCRYGLDSSDATILLEARNLGITDIVTLDKDLLRARADFNIYTWR